jgi:uncharacterized protein YdaT
MPRTKKNYPKATESLPAKAKKKAIKIANATAISRNKDWTADHNKPIGKKITGSEYTKEHGQDGSGTPAEQGCDVRRERGGRPENLKQIKEQRGLQRKMQTRPKPT